MIRDQLLRAIEEIQRVRQLRAVFVQNLKNLSDEDLLFFTSTIDESQHSLRDWILALDEFEGYLSKHPSSRAKSFRSQIEYLNCCIQGSTQGGGQLLSLQDLFLNYVGTYGVESESF